MLIRYAVETDMPSWIQLAENVAPVFRAPNMPEDPEFIQYMESKISKNEALIAVELSDNTCLGIIGFSKTHNRISWLGVFDIHQRKGVGTHLLEAALKELNTEAEVTVETYRDTYAAGFPAKMLYRKFGFKDCDNTITDKLGNEICLMSRKPEVVQPEKLLLELSHKDFGLNSDVDALFKVRKASRAILINDKYQVAILFVHKGNYYKLPGGGIEAGESPTHALKREIQDEVGAMMEILDSVGTIIEYRELFEQIQVSYAYVGRIIGEVHAPSFTYFEREHGFELRWVLLEEAIRLVSTFQGDDYMANFVSRRDGTFLKASEAKVRHYFEDATFIQAL